MYINRDKFNYFSLAELDDKYWQELTALGAVKTVKAGAMLCEQGNEISELLCVTEGTVKVVHFFDNGNEKLYEQLFAPSFIGPEALWCNDAKCYYPTVIAHSDVTLSAVPIKIAEEFIAQRPEMIISMFQCVRNIMCINRIRSVCTMPMTMLQKAAFAIVFMRGAEEDEEGYFAVTHEELAQLIGISRANVTTALTELTEKKMISKKRGKIKILDKDAMMALMNNPF